MTFNNKLKVTKERRTIAFKVLKLFIFLFLITGLTSIAIVQKLQLKSKQNHISILLEDNQKIRCDAETAIDSLKLVNKNITNSVKQRVVATMYHAVVGQCDDSPDVTADQTKIPDVHNCTQLNWIAISQDLLWFNGGPYRYGDQVIILNAGHKDGIYTIRDAMNKRFKHKIDFLESIGSKGYKFKNVLMVKVTHS